MENSVVFLAQEAFMDLILSLTYCGKEGQRMQLQLEIHQLEKRCSSQLFLFYHFMIH